MAQTAWANSPPHRMATTTNVSHWPSASVRTQGMVTVASPCVACPAPAAPQSQQARQTPAVPTLAIPRTPALSQKQLSIAAPAMVRQAQELQSKPLVAPLGSVVQERAAVTNSVLWTLECIHADGVNLTSLPKEMRTTVHRGESRIGDVPTQRVGYMFQQAFFNTLVQGLEERVVLAREHFQIWAEEVEQSATASSDSPVIRSVRRPCSFYLTNYSPVGTAVNGRLLVTGGEQIPLHAGDTVSLSRRAAVNSDHPPAPFLELRFDLSGSILCDASLVARTVETESARLLASTKMESFHLAVLSSSRRSVTPSVGPGEGFASAGGAKEPSRSYSRAGVAQDTRRSGSSVIDLSSKGRPKASPTSPVKAVATVKAGGGAEAVAKGTCFLGVDPRPLFALEIGGTAVRARLEAKDRRIIHGSPRTAGGGPCPPLLLGRTQQPEFWQKVLSDEAFNALARQHLQIEASGEGSPRTSVGFHVRNLSEFHPIRVCGSVDAEEIEAALPLEVGERSPLRHGDVIVLNASHGSTVRLLFLDLSVSKSVRGGGNAASAKTIRRPTIQPANMLQRSTANPQQPD